MAQPQAIDEARRIARASIDANSQYDSSYVVMNGLATVVACYGLFENSPAVVIGAMIIAMLLGPIAGVSLGLVDRNNPLLRKALPTLLGGILVVYGTALLLGLIHRDVPLTDEIYARTTPNLMDLMIALGGGAAGAYSMISPRLSVAFVGVAIATALVPPLSSSAICLARGEYHLALGAFLLTVTNIVGIQVAGSVVMWLGGYRGNPKTTARVGIAARNLPSVIVLCALAAFLAGQFENLVSKQAYAASVRKLLTSAATNHAGAVLVDVSFEEKSKRTIVVAVFRTPSPFTPAEIAALEPKLPPRSGTNKLELVIRSVPVSVVSGNELPVLRPGPATSKDAIEHPPGLAMSVKRYELRSLAAKRQFRPGMIPGSSVQEIHQPAQTKHCRHEICKAPDSVEQAVAIRPFAHNAEDDRRKTREQDTILEVRRIERRHYRLRPSLEHATVPLTIKAVKGFRSLGRFRRSEPVSG